MLNSLKHAISGGLSRMGYQIHRMPRSGSSGCERVTPLAAHLIPVEAGFRFYHIDRELRGQPGRVVLHNLNGHAVVVEAAG